MAPPTGSPFRPCFDKLLYITKNREFSNNWTPPHAPDRPRDRSLCHQHHLRVARPGPQPPKGGPDRGKSGGRDNVPGIPAAKRHGTGAGDARGHRPSHLRGVRPAGHDSRNAAGVADQADRAGDRAVAAVLATDESIPGGAGEDPRTDARQSARQSRRASQPHAKRRSADTRTPHGRRGASGDGPAAGDAGDHGRHGPWRENDLSQVGTAPTVMAGHGDRAAPVIGSARRPGPTWRRRDRPSGRSAAARSAGPSRNPLAHPPPRSAGTGRTLSPPDAPPARHPRSAVSPR